VLVTVARLAVDRTTNTPVVFLREAVGDRGVAIWIGGAEAAAIALALQGDQPPRPLTVDLLVAMIAATDAELRRVVISAMRGGTYYAEVELIRADGRPQRLDARPSDAIGLALRTGAEIVASESLLTIEGGASPTPPEPLSAADLREYLKQLGPEDFGRFIP
jgi:bifunctional DNase/RNase